MKPYTTLAVMPYTITGPAMGSEGSAAGGGVSDLSEWPRSMCNAGAPSPRRTSGTATGEHFGGGAENHALCVCQVRSQCFYRKSSNIFEVREKSSNISVDYIRTKCFSSNP